MLSVGFSFLEHNINTQQAMHAHQWKVLDYCCNSVDIFTELLPER